MPLQILLLTLAAVFVLVGVPALLVLSTVEHFRPRTEARRERRDVRSSSLCALRGLLLIPSK